MANGQGRPGGGPHPGGGRYGNPGDRGGRQNRGWAEAGRDRDSPRIDTSGIKLKAEEGGALSPELFDRVAREAAKAVAGDSRNQANKPTQIRQFYDELVMWEEKARAAQDRFPEYLPFIRMLNAKVAYARGRKHVDDNFVDFISCCVGQVSDYPTLRNFKTFFEAFLGFYKQERPSG
jgi:CRISPR-associated protein Csm2